MRHLVLVTIFLLTALAPATAKIGTGTPRHWIGYQLVYGAPMMGAQRCQDMGERSTCLQPLSEAISAAELWNTCLDKILFAHNLNLMWPTDVTDFRYLTQLDFRARLVEDLIAQGSYTNELMRTCLPNQTVVLP